MADRPSVRDTLTITIMRVRVLFFGMLKGLVGAAADTLELPAGASVRDLLTHYEARVPRLKELLPSVALAVNQQYAGPETKLKEGDEVGLLPPVSGGASGEAGDTSPGQPEPAPSEPKGRRYALIVREVINSGAIVEALKRGEDGAAVVFEGIVRNQTRWRRTLFLDYEAYEEMALQQMELLGEQAVRQFQVRDVALVHRLGHLEIGETSVLIAVASAHRAAGFEACRWLIDTLKRTVPIWKKEQFEDGAVWADGEPFPVEVPRANSSGEGSPVPGPASK